MKKNAAHTWLRQASSYSSPLSKEVRRLNFRTWFLAAGILFVLAPAVMLLLIFTSPAETSWLTGASPIFFLPILLYFLAVNLVAWKNLKKSGRAGAEVSPARQRMLAVFWALLLSSAAIMALLQALQLTLLAGDRTELTNFLTAIILFSWLGFCGGLLVWRSIKTTAEYAKPSSTSAPRGNLPAD